MSIVSQGRPKLRPVVEQRNSILFVNAEGQDQESLTYQELDRTTKQIAAFLIRECNLKIGDHVLEAVSKEM
jgi:acyl-coenzyme A synthetase/AMP-(fatty) acid ligase